MDILGGAKFISGLPVDSFHYKLHVCGSVPSDMLIWDAKFNCSDYRFVDLLATCGSNIIAVYRIGRHSLVPVASYCDGPLVEGKSTPVKIEAGGSMKKVKKREEKLNTYKKNKANKITSPKPISNAVQSLKKQQERTKTRQNSTKSQITKPASKTRATKQKASRSTSCPVNSIEREMQSFKKFSHKFHFNKNFELKLNKTKMNRIMKFAEEQEEEFLKHTNDGAAFTTGAQISYKSLDVCGEKGAEQKSVTIVRGREVTGDGIRGGFHLGGMNRGLSSHAKSRGEALKLKLPAKTRSNKASPKPRKQSRPRSAGPSKRIKYDPFYDYDDFEESSEELDRGRPTKAKGKGKQSDDEMEEDDGKEDFYSVTWGRLPMRDSPPVLAVAGKKGIIRVINAFTGADLSILRGHGNEIHCVSFHPTIPGLLASAGAGSESTIRLWHAYRGVCIAVLFGHRQNVVDLKFVNQDRAPEENGNEEEKDEMMGVGGFRLGPFYMTNTRDRVYPKCKKIGKKSKRVKIRRGTNATLDAQSGVDETEECECREKDSSKLVEESESIVEDKELGNSQGNKSSHKKGFTGSLHTDDTDEDEGYMVENVRIPIRLVSCGLDTRALIWELGDEVIAKFMEVDRGNTTVEPLLIAPAGEFSHPSFADSVCMVGGLTVTRCSVNVISCFNSFAKHHGPPLLAHREGGENRFWMKIDSAGSLPLKLNGEWVNSIDAPLVAFGCETGEVSTWDLRTAPVKLPMPMRLVAGESQERFIRVLAFSYRGLYLCGVVQGKNLCVLLWKRELGKPSRKLESDKICWWEQGRLLADSVDESTDTSDVRD